MFVPQTHRPGAEAEVDFGEVAVRLRGDLVTVYLFAFRMSFSGKSIHRVFASGGQEAFLEGHVHAFDLLGGVPFGKVRYDNLKAAVSRVLGFRRYRQESERWCAFRSHAGLEAFDCQPGIDGAHEKGGVEGDIGWFRRNHLVPMPEVDSLDQLNDMIDAWDVSDEARRIGARSHTVGEHFAIEKPLLKPLPAMCEVGIDITGEYPKPWTDEIVQAADVVITMGCGDACPVFPGKRCLNWELPDPAGHGVDAVRPIRDDIEELVRGLLADLNVPATD